MSHISVEDFPGLLNEDLSGLPATYVAALIEATELQVARFYGQPLGLQEFTEKLRGRVTTYGARGVLQIMLTYAPIASVASVGVWYSTDAATALDVSEVIIDSQAGSILVPFGIFGTWTSLVEVGGRYMADVTYSAGEAGDIPADVKRALALLVQEQLAADAQSSMESTEDVISYKIAEYSETRQSGQDRAFWRGLGLGTRNSRTAAAILDNYFRSAGAVLI